MQYWKSVTSNSAKMNSETSCSTIIFKQCDNNVTLNTGTSNNAIIDKAT